MTRVLVSGGTGFVGRFIVEHLMERGYEVVVGGRTPPAAAFFFRPVPFVPLLLNPDLDQATIFDGVQCFVHAAFEHVEGKYRGGEGDDPEGFRRANVEGSARLFEAARAAGVKRCVFLSSRAVYGSKLAGTVDERSPTDPDTLYGQVKVAGEDRLRLLATEEFVTASLRITGVYGAAGPGRRHKWANLFATYLDGQSVQPRIATEVHGDDAAAAVRLVLEADAAEVRGEVFDVSDVLVDVRQILSIVQEVNGCVHPLPEAASANGYLVMSTEKLRRLGWNPGGFARLRDTIAELTVSL